MVGGVEALKLPAKTINALRVVLYLPEIGFAESFGITSPTARIDVSIRLCEVWNKPKHALVRVQEVHLNIAYDRLPPCVTLLSTQKNFLSLTHHHKSTPVIG
jgi:hypothetical protein